jgi:tetratricopeptide (TPR) repeat protein
MYALIAVAVLQIGCRAIANRRPDRRLFQARQLSQQGVDLLSRNQPQAAEEYFNRAIDQYSGDERAHWGISQTLWEHNQRDQAIVHMKEAVRLSGNPDYLVRLGEMHLQQGQIPEALKISDQLLDRWHDNAGAWQLRGEALANQREWDGALKAYHRSLLLQPDNPQVQLAVAEIYRQTQRSQRALATLDRMVDQRPSMTSDGQMNLFRGLALADLGRRDEAIAAYNAATRHLQPTDLRHQLQLAGAQHQIGMQDQAKQTLASVLKEYPDNSEAIRLAGVFDMSFGHLANLPLGDSDAGNSLVR